MKEIIKKKMEKHVERILLKDEITNEDYFLLCSVLQRMEGEERLAEMQAKSEADKVAWEEKRKELADAMFKVSGLLNYKEEKHYEL